MWIRETRIILFMQMKLEVCSNELDWLIKCYLCAVNDYPKECCPPMPLPIPPGYHTNLRKRAEMAANDTLPPTLKMILKTYYPLPVSPHPDIPSCSSSRRSTEPESWGDDQTESDYLGAQADGRGEEQSEISLAVEPDDTPGKHQNAEIPLEQARFSEGEGCAVPKRVFPVLIFSSACKGLEGPKEPHPLTLQTAAEGVSHADQGGKFGFQEDIGRNNTTSPR